MDESKYEGSLDSGGSDLFRLPEEEEVFNIDISLKLFRFILITFTGSSFSFKTGVLILSLLKEVYKTEDSPRLYKSLPQVPTLSVGSDKFVVTNKPGIVILGVHADYLVFIRLFIPRGNLVPSSQKVVLVTFITHIITTTKQSRRKKKYTEIRKQSLIVLPLILV